MRALKYLSLPLLTTGLLLGPTAPTHAQSSLSKPRVKTDQIVIKITDTGTLWGRVTASYKSGRKSVTKTCSKASCTWKIASGTKVKFKESPTNTQTWPFKDWEIAKKGSHAKKVTKTTTTLKVNGNYTIKVVYVVA